MNSINAKREEGDRPKKAKCGKKWKIAMSAPHKKAKIPRQRNKHIPYMPEPKNSKTDLHEKKKRGGFFIGCFRKPKMPCRKYHRESKIDSHTPISKAPPHSFFYRANVSAERENRCAGRRGRQKKTNRRWQAMLKNIEICPESIDIFVFFGYNKYTNIP